MGDRQKWINEAETERKALNEFIKERGYQSHVVAIRTKEGHIILDQDGDQNVQVTMLGLFLSHAPDGYVEQLVVSYLKALISPPTGGVKVGLSGN